MRGDRADDLAAALASAATGDERALGVVWRAHQARLLRYLRGRGLEDAEGLTTQIWIDVARNLDRFRGGPDDFRRWLFTIAHRRAVDARRRQARQVATRPLAPADESAALAPGADAEHAEREALAAALALVATLPDQMREALLLRVVGDLSVADTAAVMGIAPGNVRVLVHRGLRRLEQELGTGDQPVTAATAPGPL